MSPLLFAVYLESLCQRLVHYPSIPGFPLESSELKLFWYADDVAVFGVDQDSVRVVVNSVSILSLKSGSAINWDKCIGFRHGKWTEVHGVFVNVRWTALSATYFGVLLVHDRDSVEYWKEGTGRVWTRASVWKELSVFGRAMVCNFFLVAKVWYVLQALSMPLVNLQKLHGVFDVFIWSSSSKHCRGTISFRLVLNGGLGLSQLFISKVSFRFSFLRDQKDIFLHTVIHVLLRNVPSKVVVFSSSTNCFGVQGHTREVELSFRFLKARFSFDFLSPLTRKTRYRYLVGVLLPIPLCRPVYHDCSGQDVLGV